MGDLIILLGLISLVLSLCAHSWVLKDRVDHLYSKSLIWLLSSCAAMIIGVVIAILTGGSNYFVF